MMEGNLLVALALVVVPPSPFPSAALADFSLLLSASFLLSLSLVVSFFLSVAYRE